MAVSLLLDVDVALGTISSTVSPAGSRGGHTYSQDNDLKMKSMLLTLSIEHNYTRFSLLHSLKTIYMVLNSAVFYFVMFLLLSNLLIYPNIQENDIFI